MSYEGEEPIEVNGKKVVAFKESGEWDIPEGVESVDVLVVGGGGGGGSRYGGGGAGGLIFKPNHEIQGTSPLTITVGSGGAGASADGGQGTDGGNSIFENLTAIGGGGGGGQSPTSGRDGGSGGGSGGTDNSDNGEGIQPNQSGDSGTFGYGNDGGEMASGGGGGTAAGGGGGGAGEVGQTSSASNPGDGGDGLKEVTINSINYNFASIFGDTYGEKIDNDVWFAGGGGGSGAETDNASEGGKGGGADGKDGNDSQTPNNALENTGGGGAGGPWDGDGLAASSGGSGIVILAYEDPFVPPTNPTELEPQLEFEQFSFTGSSLDFDLEPMVQAGSTVTTINGVIQTSNEGVIQTK